MSKRYMKIRDSLSWRQYLMFLFWERVERGCPDECWIWQGVLTPKGYGKVSPRKEAGGRQITILAPRLSYRLFRGKISEGLCVCHSCDTPACVNPKHLFLGTRGDNAKDRDQKGRQARGEKSGMAKLTAELVLEIRQLGATGKLTFSKIAERFDLGPTTVSSILKGRIWKHLPLLGVIKSAQSSPAKLERSLVIELRARYASGKFTLGDLAEMFGVAKTTAGAIVRGKTWKDAPGSTTRKFGAHFSRAGSSNGGAKLTDGAVVEIRELSATREYTDLELAERFGVSGITIGRVVRGESWGHLPVLKGKKYGRVGEDQHNAKLFDGSVREIRRLHSEEGYSYYRLAALFGVSPSNVREVVLRRTWKHVE